MSDISHRVVTVTTTYLHLPSREHFRPALLDDPDLLVMEAREPLPRFYRFLYDAVGRGHTWIDRLAWSDDRLRAYLSRPAVTLFALYVRGTPAGYIELDAAPEEDEGPGTQVMYFGLIPAFHGRGLGKHLLSVGVARAFDDGASRVWVNTCSLDGPYTLPNYQARGFIPYKTVTHEQAIGDGR